MTPRPDLNPLPLSDLVGKASGVVVIMAHGQEWNNSLDSWYGLGCLLIAVGADGQPAAAYQRPLAVIDHTFDSAKAKAEDRNG